MSIEGTYLLESNENYQEWLAAVGVPADSAAKMAAAKPTLEVSKTGDAVVIKTIVGDKNFTNTLNLGKDSTASLPGGVEYTVNLAQEGSCLKGTWTMGGKSGTACVEISAAGVTQTMTVGAVKSKRVYKRQ